MKVKGKEEVPRRSPAIGVGSAAAGKDEATIRKDNIDGALLAAGWERVIPYKRGEAVGTAAVEENPTDNGPADYVLYHDGEPLAIVEGKRPSLDPQNVVVQAERYARGMRGTPFSFGEYEVPFVYSTNGVKFWFRDLRRATSRSRQVSGFHTPAALRGMLGHDVAKAERWLRTTPIDHRYLRPYQKAAISSVEGAILRGKRKMMVAMATGTGKTVMATELVHRLLASGMFRRVLFLVDRRALAAQAVGAMAAFEAEPGLKFDRIYEVYSQQFRKEDLDEDAFDPRVLPNEYLTAPKAGRSFVYVSTVQRMRANLFGLEADEEETGDEDDLSDAVRLSIPIDAFDLVIADECHRGYNTMDESRWRAVLDHFDAVRIGLTATPAKHTMAYFEGAVFTYDYERAVREGYLVDYDPVLIESEVRAKGVSLKEGEGVSVVDTTTGEVAFEQLEDEIEFSTSDIERALTVPDSNRKIVREFLKYADEFERERGHFPKTIVFACNDLPHRSHADQLVEILRDECGRGDDFVQKITGNPTVDRPLERIREFRNRPEPAIAVTVDMLTTGVDIPSVEAILFARPVRSRILFEQMLGRGTRKCPDIHKDRFMVFDAVGALELFRNRSSFTAEPPSRPTRPLKDIIEAIDNNQDRKYNVKVLVRRLQRVNKRITREGRDALATFIPDGDIGRFAEHLPEMIERGFVTTMALLKEPRLQAMLEDYPRPPVTFIVANGPEDTVTSKAVFRTHDGRELKPEDYIQAFERFVRENPDHIAAITLLVNNPGQFTPAALEELRAKLAAREENFSEDNLRRAYDHAPTDIISMVRHAALGEELVPTHERVRRGLERVRAGLTLTPQQEQWFVLIEDHLSHNLLITKENFATIPFSRHGAWRKADADFGGNLEPLLKKINEAVIL